MQYINKNNTLYEILFKQRNIFLDIGMILVSVIVMAGLANLRIALWPVPVTMQTFGVFLVAFFFGSRKGLIAIISYLLAGLIGFAVFTGYNSGYAAFLGPTAGYLVGFLACVFLVGYLIEKGYGRTKTSVLGVMIVGNVVIYTFGIIGLWRYMGNVGIVKILMAGLVPFLIGDAIKILAAVGLFPYLWKGAEKISG